MLKKIIKSICPPILLAMYKSHTQKYGFWGDYGSWVEAEKMCGGYNSISILAKVKQSALKVKNGEAVFERDSVIYNCAEHNYPLLTCLFYISGILKNRLRLLDFGGSLGNTYYQCRDLLVHLEEVQWSVVEQRHFVECGQKYFQDNSLDFFFNIDDCIGQKPKDVLLLSSVIQYLEQPYVFIQKVFICNFAYIIIDRTPFFDFPDRITVQKVSPEIYEASYPAWFFNRNKFMDFIAAYYDLIFEWDSFEAWDLGDVKVNNKGMLLRLKNK